MNTKFEYIKRIVIVGGGTAGWMAAACLSKILGRDLYEITLVESDDIGTVGVGEATIPQIHFFNKVLDINEDDFIRETNATIKLGIRFVDWKSVGESYFHPFGSFGLDMDGVLFSHFWLRWVASGGDPDSAIFNVETLAAREGRFARTPAGHRPDLPKVTYAFQFDASLYAAWLRRYAESRGVIRIEGRIIDVVQDAQTGFVTRLKTDKGAEIDGDFFIDCSGFRGLLIEQTLGTGYEDWSRWLPCDRAVAVPTEKPAGPTRPYTTATAREAGWQWHIPLQSRTGNGYVFCSDFISEDEATTKLLSRLDGKPLRDPKILRFKTGHRKQMWNKNVLALGLASGFLEPLESTSIHLVQSGLAHLMTMLPRKEFSQTIASQYNREMLAEYDNIKDFLIAHYHVTDREDTPFWKRNKAMEIPDSLKARLEIFRSSGQAAVQQTEMFREPSWFAVLMGQGFYPKDHHPVAEILPAEELSRRMAHIRRSVRQRVDSMPRHDDFIAAVSTGKQV